MGSDVIRAVMPPSLTAGYTRLVLLALAHFANDHTHACFPSVAKLSELTGMHPDNVRKNLRRLEESGEVMTDRGAGPNGVNSYRFAVLVTPPRAAGTPRAAGSPRAAGAPPHAETVDPPTRATSPPLLGNQSETQGNPTAAVAAVKGGGEVVQLFGGEVEVVDARPDHRAIFGALAAVAGVALDEITPAMRGRLNRATKDLAELPGPITAEEIAHRAQLYRETWPKTRLTASALVSHWGEMNPRRQHAPVKPRGEVDAERQHEQEIRDALARAERKRAEHRDGW